MVELKPEIRGFWCGNFPITQNGHTTAYSMTWSAAASKGWGKVRLSALSLLRLIAHDRRGCFQGYSGRACGEVARQISDP
jgi:hypothetical protein